MAKNNFLDIKVSGIHDVENELQRTLNTVRSIEIEKEYKSQIKRIFQVANRRIQNLEKSEIASPALKALEQTGQIKKSGFARFSRANIDLKTKQGILAISQKLDTALKFVNNPTSTVRGAKKFIENIFSDTPKLDKKLTFEDKNRIADSMFEPRIMKRIDSSFRYDPLKEQLGNYEDEYNDDINNLSSTELAEEIAQRYNDLLDSKTDEFDTYDLY